ncbi:MAG: hypothetical protein HXS44_12180 [Theionarchaea archaeon]|nr:hypothetical protein [Theionarchaea archaeon]
MAQVTVKTKRNNSDSWKKETQHTSYCSSLHCSSPDCSTEIGIKEYTYRGQIGITAVRSKKKGEK